MATNPDFKDLFIILNEESVEYLLVGARAMAYYAEPHSTKEEIWVRPSRENGERVCRALGRFFGAAPDDVSAQDFADPETVYQIGVAPSRVDLIAGIADVEFAEAWARRIESTYGDVPIHVLGKEDLIRAKRAAGRPQDLLDVDKLEKA